MKRMLVNTIAIVITVLTIVSCSQEKGMLYLERDTDGTWTIHLTNGKVSGLKYDDLYFISSGGLIRARINKCDGLIDTLGKVVISPIYKSISPYDGYFLVKTFSETNGLFEYGKGLIVDTLYNSIRIISDRYIMMDKIKPNSKYETSIIDRTNSEIIAVFKSQAYILSRASLSVEVQPGEYRFYCLDSKEFGKNSYQNIYYNRVKIMRSDIALVRGNDLYGFCDLNGNEIVAPEFDDAVQLSAKYISVRKHNKWGIYDNCGNQILKTEYDYVELDSTKTNNNSTKILFRVSKNEKWGYFDDLSKVFIPLKYDRISSFSEGLAAVQNKGLYGYVDTIGEIRIGCKFQLVSDFSEGKAWVIKDDKWCIVYKNAKIRPVDMPMFDSVPARHCSFSNFRDGLSVFRVNNIFGLIDSNLNILIYNQVPRWNEACYLVFDSRDETKGIAFGNPFRYIEADHIHWIPKAEHIIVSKDESYSLIDTTGKIIPLPGIDYIQNDFQGVVSAKANQKRYVFLSMSDFLKYFGFSNR